MLRSLRALTRSGLYVVRGDSMLPALRRGDRLLVVSADAATLSRGDIVVFWDPRGSGERRLKRVVGMPGEAIRAHDGRILVNGAHLPEPYLGGLPAVLGLGDTSWRLDAGEFFLMGDNRAHSTDSRDCGPVKAGSIVGKVWFRYWPVTRLGPLD